MNGSGQSCEITRKWTYSSAAEIISSYKIVVRVSREGTVVDSSSQFLVGSDTQARLGSNSSVSRVALAAPYYAPMQPRYTLLTVGCKTMKEVNRWA